MTYTVTVSNLGPGDVTGATVTDELPAELLSATWTCFAADGASCTTGPVAGNVNDVVDLAVGSSVTYTIEATVAEESTGTILNTASAAVPDGVLDPVPENDSASDEDTVERADLELAKRALTSVAVSGGTVGWEIVVTNLGPDDAMGARVVDTMPDSVAETSWECSAAGDASCVESGGGGLSEKIDLPVGGSATFTLRSRMAEDFAGILQNTARVLPPAGLPDPVPGNNVDGAVLTVKVPIFFDEFESGDTSTWSDSVGEKGIAPVQGVIGIISSRPRQTGNAGSRGHSRNRTREHRDVALSVSPESRTLPRQSASRV